MKNLLIASSVLAMSAGFAQADAKTTFGGTLAFGIAINGTGNGGKGDNGDSVLPNNQYHVYSTINLVATIAGTSDYGLSFGTSIDFSAGPDYALADDDGFNDNDGSWASPAIFVTGSWGTVTFKSNDIDFYNSDAFNGGGDGTLITNQGVDTLATNSGDFKYEGTWGGLFTGLVVDIETGDASGKVSYTLAGVDLSADYSVDSNPANPSGGLWDVNLGYNWQTFNFTLGADNDNSDHDYSTDYFVKVGTTFAGIDGYVQYNNHSQNQMCDRSVTPAVCTANPEAATWDIGATYTTGPLSLTATAENITDANGGPVKWTATTSYALASGVAFQAGLNYTGDAMVGATFSF